MEPSQSTAPMFSGVFRVALFLATMVVASTLARSAFAAPAPFCDDRGATALAAPPDLQAPDDVLQRARAEACGFVEGADADGWRSMVRPARTTPSVTSQHPAPVRLTVDLRIAPPLSVLLPAPELPRGPPMAEGSRLERPPRRVP